MKRKLWLAVSFIVGVYLSLYTWHWVIFILSALAITICVYFAGINSVHTFQALRHSQYKKTFGKLLVSIILLILTLGIWLVSIGSGVFTGMPIPHLRTNIITSNCSLNVSNDIADPWFYTRGCNISKDEKIALLQNDHRFSFVQQQCENSRGDNDFSGWLNWDEVTCSDLLK